MARPSKYPRELQERAVRMVAEVRPDYPSEHAAMVAVAGMLGVGSPETIRGWIRPVSSPTFSPSSGKLGTAEVWVTPELHHVVVREDGNHA